MSFGLIGAVVAILFAYTFVRSALGFGGALVAMPLLALVVDLRVATPLVGLVGFINGAGILLTDWHKADHRASWRLIVASMIGIPCGLLLLELVPEHLVKMILGVLLILYALYNLFTPGLPAIQHNGLAYGLGFLAGVLGSAYNTNGPPVVIYGVLRRWPPNHFRATLQSYFFFTSIAIILGQALDGLWTRQVWQLFLLALPAVGLGIVVGNRAGDLIPKALFIRVIYTLLIVFGILFLI